MKIMAGVRQCGRESASTAHPITTAQLKKPRLSQAQTVRIDARTWFVTLSTIVAPIIRKNFFAATRACAQCARPECYLVNIRTI
jgi:hypothetical protein